ncbi:von Willebrand factor A domain-containing protein 3A-like isoform X3 [Mercenaria mercenaria]|uniref:von Willebrand factor A domain-containing protein 3A-like isoform X3 n=1 Tax=Mercenaria mercenaria TaxID=6596 RepID=UPI00234EB24D|nr:von Willebrand factor A domain-containing protein 3A-like isoform X3 [Mercenaria mercenaria]
MDIFGSGRRRSKPSFLGGIDEESQGEINRSFHLETARDNSEKKDAEKEKQDEEDNKDDASSSSDDSDGEDFLDDSEEEWHDVYTENAKPPSALTVTHVSHTHDLQQLADIEAAVNAEHQTSDEWLKSHSLEYMNLELKDLVDRGKIGRLEPDLKTGKPKQHIQFDAYDVNEFEYKLNLAIETFTKRIKWLLTGSKRVFGNVKGERCVLCVDTSDANTGFGRLTAFQESLIHLVDEQFPEKRGIYLMSFGTDVDPLWPVVRDVNIRIIEEAKEWVMRLKQSGGCNLLKAMKHIYKLKDIDSIVLVLGSVPDQASDILCDYLYQMGVGRSIPIHCVAYDCSNQLTNLTLRNIAEASQGRYHCYTASCEEQIYTGTDISVLLKEIQKAQDVINKIKEMRQGMMGSALISIMNEITTEVQKLPQSRFLPRPPGHDKPLKIEMPKFQPKSSVDWIGQHGLKAKQLDLYQVLAPNAYSYKEEFIPVIKKAVQSQVHEKAMVQFKWHDGTVKNVHVDMTQLFEYQKHLAATVSVYESRIDWLASGSRRIFGTVVEKNVVIMLDLSVSNVNYLVHIQHSLRLLMEQQLANKEYFNIIAFGSIAVSWKPTMCKPTKENLQDAWRWVLDLQCGGSRNFLSAFRKCVENEEERSHKITAEGIYLFTSGVPDQDINVCQGFIEESCGGKNIKLHTILFNVDDYDSNGAIPGRYANITRTAESLRNLAHSSGGRFHWIRETGIIESDDIQVVTTEVDKCLNFSRKCQMLIDNVKKKYKERYHTEQILALPAPERHQRSRISASKQLAIKYEAEDVEEGESRTMKSRQRPSSAKASGSETMLPMRSKDRPATARDPLDRVKKKKLLKSSFFLDSGKTRSGDGTGTVFRKYPAPRPVRKSVAHPTLPDSEDQMTTKEWLRLYSLSKLKLDLTKLVSGPDCKHVEDSVKTLNKQVSAKYCDIFPSINIKGTVKHLQLMPHELEDYEKQVEKVLKRYLKRLQWLLSGSRRVFGTVVHRKCAILIDTSGSMVPYMEELKKELASLIWEQLYRQGCRFNLIRFSGNCEKWQDNIQPATQENCHSAIKWASTLKASGNTCTLEALQLAFDDPEIDSVYLLTDGKPDTSTSLVLREVAENTENLIPINTISFNCNDNTANNFLHLLATETSGRYHRCHSDFDAQLFAHKLLTEGFCDAEYPHLPDLEGDDLRKLGQEITLARKYLQQARQYRALYKSKSHTSNTTDSGDNSATARSKISPFVVGRPKTSAR